MRGRGTRSSSSKPRISTNPFLCQDDSTDGQETTVVNGHDHQDQSTQREHSSFVQGIAIYMNIVVAKAAVTYDGSSLLQEKLKSNNKLIFSGVYDYLFEVMTNRYGQYVFAKLIEICDPSQLHRIAHHICSSQLMTNKIGYSVVVQCLNTPSTRQNEELYEQIVRHCLELATNEHGCIALNECITCIRGPRRSQLFNVISSNAVHLSQDPSG
ncbi:Coatomer beta subunit [Parasponia andersonii]|uniref:Coatomer beta subunit n=1 Tax=Parasponia andersonii TaxID=3476 RepID=A0A2P5CTI3_PARAD|nr:Coatomer beta subunit [Parasponia andersonii]